MKKILIYHGKHDNQYYDISTPKLESSSYKTLFKELDEDWGFYDDLKDDSELKESETRLAELKSVDVSKLPKSVREKLDPKEISELEHEIGSKKDEMSLYEKAKSGDVKSIKQLLDSRSDYEYEGVSTSEVN